MSEMFTYSYVKGALKNKSYLWEDNFELIEQVITPSEVIIAYPKNLYNDDVEKCVFFFQKNCIYNLIFESSKLYKVIAFNPKSILKIIIDTQGRGNATLKIIFSDEEIILSSTDSMNEFQDYKYVEALLQITKLYSS
jgi:hypothetical protein